PVGGKAVRVRRRFRLTAGAAVNLALRPGQPQQLRRPAQAAPAPHGQPIPAAFAAMGDVDPCPPWPCHDARTARIADNDAAPRVIVPNHAITGSYAAAPLRTPRPNP